MYDSLASASEGIECEVVAFIYICKWSWQGLVHWNLPSIDTYSVGRSKPTPRDLETY